MLPLALGLLAVALIGVYLALCGLLYGRVFVPPRPGLLDDFMFTPWEFQADYEEIDLVTADGISFGAWFFRQPGPHGQISLATAVAASSAFPPMLSPVVIPDPHQPDRKIVLSDYL